MFVFCRLDLGSGLSSGLSGSVPCPRNSSSYSQGEWGRLRYLLQVFFLPCPLSFSAGAKLYQGITLAFLKRVGVAFCSCPAVCCLPPKYWRIETLHDNCFQRPFYSVTKLCSEFPYLICLHGRKQGKLRWGNLGYFSSWIPWCITSNVR